MIKVFYQLCIIDLMKIKYPSTNIRMDVFLKHVQLIKDLNYDFIHPEEFEKNFDIPKNKKKSY